MTRFIKIVRYVVLAGVLLAFASILSIKFDRAVNYESVQAVVLDFSKSCRPLSSDQNRQALFDATPEFAHGKLGPCEALGRLGIAEDDFQMDGRRNIVLRVERFWRTHVRYVSPADGQTHESFVGLGPKDGEGLAMGKTLTVLASKKNADDLQEP